MMAGLFMTALGMVGQAQSKDTLKALRDIYRDNEDPNVRRGAVFGMGFVGDRTDVPFLLSVLESAKDDSAMARYTRGAAVVALGMILIFMGFWRRTPSFLKHAYTANVAMMSAGFVLVGYQLTGLAVS